MESFAFKKSFKFYEDDSKKNVAHSFLTEKMAIKGDHLYLDYDTVYDGNDVKHIEHKLRKHEPVFCEEPEH
jgi:hypothetical protein